MHNLNTMIHQYQLQLPPYKRGIHLISDQIIRAVKDFPMSGLVNIFICHTSAGLLLNENTDPGVMKDLQKIFDDLVPENDRRYAHNSEGPDDMPAHAKSALCGHSLSIPIVNKRLGLGLWQGICLCEFRNHAGSRRLIITVIS